MVGEATFPCPSSLLIEMKARLLEGEQPLWSMMGLLHGAGQEKPDLVANHWSLPSTEPRACKHAGDSPRKAPLLLFTVI